VIGRSVGATFRGSRCRRSTNRSAFPFTTLRRHGLRRDVRGSRRSILRAGADRRHPNRAERQWIESGAQSDEPRAAGGGREDALPWPTAIKIPFSNKRSPIWLGNFVICSTARGRSWPCLARRARLRVRHEFVLSIRRVFVGRAAVRRQRERNRRQFAAHRGLIFRGVSRQSSPRIREPRQSARMVRYRLRDRADLAPALLVPPNPDGLLR